MKSLAVEKVLKAKANKLKAQLLSKFFKTGKGEYGEGDVFLGITVPEQRLIAKEFVNIPLEEVQKLLQSPLHECRFTALLILTYKYSKADEKEKNKIFDFYIKNTKYINNWDLVDVTCHKIVGEYLFEKDRKILYKLAKSKNLWEKRIAIISTFYFIRERDFSDSIKIAEMLLGDTHDLIHKAVGWMLREVGKKDENVLHDFLKIHTKKMPRTALRYAIERLPEEFRRFYMRL
ncbi:MAG: DNA alkylation repair protein [bacterium]